MSSSLPAGRAPALLRRAGDEALYAAACARSGMLGVRSPRRALRGMVALARQGLLAGALGAAAVRHADRAAIRDERGELSYRELQRRTNALANAWRARGLQAGDGVAIMARNHRGFVEAVFAAAKCGARIVLLNTSFAGPQVREVAEREGARLIVCDDEHEALLNGLAPRLGCWRAWDQEPSASGPAPAVGGGPGAPETIESLMWDGDPSLPPRPARAPRIVILTSGTTGVPKGAPRQEPRSLAVVGGVLGRVPFRAAETTVLAVPMFHAFGLANMVLAIALGSTLVLHRRFDPEATLAAVAESRATALVVVPVMLARIMELGEQRIAAGGPYALRVIYVSGSALGVDLARRATSAFGPVLYNLYGSTEVAYATIAGPSDLAAAPGTVGRSVRGTTIRILDDRGAALPAGSSGRIFVGSAVQFEGYTDGADKERVDGLVSTGDVGHLNADGRLFIDGRDDEMIVSGGENVFPAEVEELLAGHEAIREAAVIGVDDAEFGQRLKAFVVVRDGAGLTPEGVQAHVRDHLARYKVPREVVLLDELPRNPAGKVLKRELH